MRKMNVDKKMINNIALSSQYPTGLVPVDKIIFVSMIYAAVFIR